MNFLTLEQFAKASGQAGSPYAPYPGSTTTAATVRYMAALCAMYCCHNEEEFEMGVRSSLLGDTADNESFLRLGSAFCACNDRNMGNKYASPTIEGVLKYFSGKRISKEMGELLSILEQFLIASGDAEVVKAKAGDT